MLYSHPEQFMTGFRVLVKVRRKKDNNEKNYSSSYISKSEKQFAEMIKELYFNLKDNERLYATASPRSVKKASRLFREQQLESEYSDTPMQFYESLESRWASCLASPKSLCKQDKLWMFDCDEPEDTDIVLKELSNRSVMVEYQYTTKLGGCHILVKPFNRDRLLTSRLLHTNPTMLWAYK